MQTRHYYITLQNAQLATLLSQWELKLNCKMCLISTLIYVRNCSREHPFFEFLCFLNGININAWAETSLFCREFSKFEEYEDSHTE